jgi:hypothetical protein
VVRQSTRVSPTRLQTVFWSRVTRFQRRRVGLMIMLGRGETLRLRGRTP